MNNDGKKVLWIIVAIPKGDPIGCDRAFIIDPDDEKDMFTWKVTDELLQRRKIETPGFMMLEVEI